ncbi:MAG: 30S ribosomal protein S20, partial [Candidatus Puniceispirillales bacterium]
DRRSRIRTFIKKVESAIANGDQTAAREALKEAQPEMHRGVTRGIFHKNTISRKLSRLSAAIKGLAA